MKSKNFESEEFIRWLAESNGYELVKKQETKDVWESFRKKLAEEYKDHSIKEIEIELSNLEAEKRQERQRLESVSKNTVDFIKKELPVEEWSKYFLDDQNLQGAKVVRTERIVFESKKL
jgi:predicted SPOUT superfamily RNA methylase MTH1